MFKGTRVPVQVVAEYLKPGKGHDEILEAFPNLTVKDIEAAKAQLTSVAQMRFLLDEDIDARAVGTLLRNHGHQCWTIVDAGLSRR
jgi:hypothetical protein